MNTFNTVLLTSLGSLSAPFVIDTLKKNNYLIIGTDINEKEVISSSRKVDFFKKVSKIDNPFFLEEVMSICKSFKVTLIIPLTDLDVDFFSENFLSFKNLGIKIVLPNRKLLILFRDKRELSKELKKENIKTINSYCFNDIILNNISFPIISKPIKGRSSEGFLKHNSIDDISLSRKKDLNFIFQPFIEGTIIVVDLIHYNKTKEFYYIARKELLRTKNGAGLSVEIFDDKKLRLIIQDFCKKFPFNGVINIEFILDEFGDYFLMDINPRFSAGVVFSDYAGYNFVLNSIKISENKEIEKLKTLKLKTIVREYIEIVAK